jgi:transcription antitermination factor NusG
MKKLLLLTLIAFTFSGCSMLSAKKAEEVKPAETKEAKETKDEKKTDDAKIKEGDTVVGKWGTSFYEGKVEKIDGSKIKIAWLDKSAPTDVDSNEVYAMPASGAKPDVKAGDKVLAKISSSGSFWAGAEVVSIDGDVYKVRDVSGNSTANISGEKVIKVSSATAANISDRASSTDFLKDAQTHKPTVPSDFKPKKGDKVVAEWTTNSWYSGKIDRVDSSKIYVAWDDGSNPSPVNTDRVMPLPTSTNKEMPTENQFLLIKPASGTKWQFAQVSKINGSSVEAKMAGDKTQTVKAGEFILLN